MAAGWEVVIVSGPVEVGYPPGCRVVPVISTEEMLAAAEELFPQCDGLIGAAAPCDYRPVKVESNKIQKTGEPLRLHLIETPDVVASLGQRKAPHQWAVGFALETEDARFRALVKLEKKSCDLIVLNGPQAMNAKQRRGNSRSARRRGGSRRTQTGRGGRHRATIGERLIGRTRGEDDF